ncbi:UbiA-like protein EboC [Rhodoflexus caldus]|uniref:UbiA-like protein EboC n=1 Tax=Rhodoflexus caldus TaxID=2891236 RepID=UPI00202A16C3|nr:UbiA-like protein EboC [Rhodoflexus caldus]
MKPYLQLMRPPNLPTAMSDVAAGAAVAAFFVSEQLPDWALLEELSWGHLSLLLFATVCLYAGGVVMNDVFDADIDAVERPERPIPSGRVPLENARTMGLTLLLAGVLASFTVNALCGGVALTVALLALVYDRYAKHHAFWGPFTMGLCRAGNLLLGMSWTGQWQPIYMLIVTAPLAYIASITYVSRFEVRGGNAQKLGRTFMWELWAITAPNILGNSVANNLWQPIPFVILLMVLITPPLAKAQKEPTPENIKKAVKSRVIGLIALNAAWAAAFGGWQWGLAVLMLMPISRLLAKTFAVT